MVEFKQLNQDEAALILEAIDKYASPCVCCGKPVIGTNFGIIHAIGVCCNSILCQSEMISKIEDGEEASRLPINWRSNKEVIKLVKSEKQRTAKEIQKIAKTMIKKNDEGEEGQNAYYAQGLHEGFENGLVILHDVIENRFLSNPQSDKEVKE